MMPNPKTGELQIMLARAKELPVEDLPRLLGCLREIEATAMARLTAPVSQRHCDELIDVATASQRLGISEDYLYRHHRQFAFARRVGRKLLFSSLGIDHFIQKQKHLTANR